MITRRRLIQAGASFAVVSSTGLLLPLRALAQSVAAYDFYISPSGSNDNPGTAASPWAITALRDKTSVIAGKRVGLLDGIYNLSFAATGGNNGGLTISAANVTVKAVNSRQAIITTNSNGAYPGSTSPALRIVGNGVALRDLRWQQFSFDPLSINATDVVIDGCDFYDVDHSRIASNPDNIGFIFSSGDPVVGDATSARVSIRNCRFERVRSGGGAVGNDNNCAIGPLYRTRDWTIEDCSFFDCGHAIGWKNFNSGGLIVRRCYFGPSVVLNAVHGFGSDSTPGNPHIAENNIFNNPGYALGEWDPGNSKTSITTKVRNNTFLTTSQSNVNGMSVLSIDDSANPLPADEFHQSEFYNNIVFRRSGTAPLLFFYPGATFVQRYGIIDYNLYPPSASVIAQVHSAAGGGAFSLAAWRAALRSSDVIGQEVSSSQAVAPTFKNVNGTTPADYQLEAGSLGIGSGRVGGTASGARIDLGAWGGATSIGHNFESKPTPMAPELVEVS